MSEQSGDDVRLEDRLRRLEDLANDLYYSWSRGVRRLFGHLDPDNWRACAHNPKVFLRRVSQRRLEEAAKHWKSEAEKPNGKPDGLLWRPPDLDLARDYVSRIEGSLAQLQFDFYQFSDRTEKERVAEKEKQQRKMRRRLLYATTAASRR